VSTRVPLAEPLLKPEDVARLLRMPRSSVYELHRRQRDPLPCLRLGRAVRYERRELEAWLARQRSEQR
jgi:predicted DNA-binding transcriptional regulator AlpA